ncbi:hypothetical protein FACS189492_2550 [Clostridia bacterium]|nr:hypothetical protein FACS189492_2550 [Clostridia bacterium]
MYNAVQSWYPPEGDYEQYIRRAAWAGYRVFSFWLYWRHLEPSEGSYDMGVVERVIELAERYDMKLDIVWAGVDFCDHLDKRFAPDWLLARHDWHLQAEDGCVRADGYDMGEACAFDPRNGLLFEKEAAVLRRLFGYIAWRDVNRRIVMIQVENEINIQGYHGVKDCVLRYVDDLAGVIKAAYPIDTRVNILSRVMDGQIDQMRNIDAQGVDTYDPRLSVTRRAILDGRNTKVRYIAENGGYENTTAHMVTALAAGGFYNLFRIDHDTVWDKPGVYGRDWEILPHTLRIKSLNEAMNRKAAIVAAAPRESMLDFNCERDDSPAQVYEAQKNVEGREVGFQTADGAVGLAVRRGGDPLLLRRRVLRVHGGRESIPVHGRRGSGNTGGRWKWLKTSSETCRCTRF